MANQMSLSKYAVSAALEQMPFSMSQMSLSQHAVSSITAPADGLTGTIPHNPVQQTLLGMGVSKWALQPEDEDDMEEPGNQMSDSKWAKAPMPEPIKSQRAGTKPSSPISQAESAAQKQDSDSALGMSTSRWASPSLQTCSPASSPKPHSQPPSKSAGKNKSKNARTRAAKPANAAMASSRHAGNGVPSTSKITEPANNAMATSRHAPGISA